MNPFIHCTPKQKQLLFSALATHRNKMIARKIEIEKSSFQQSLKDQLTATCLRHIDETTICMDEVRRSTNRTLKIS